MTFDADALSATDRELQALGRDPADAADLIARHIGSDRTLSRIDSLLADLSSGVELAPLPALAPPKPKSPKPPKLPKQKREPAAKREAPAVVESALREVRADEIPPVPPPSMPPPPAENAIDTVERDVANMLDAGGSLRPPAFAPNDLEELTPQVHVPSRPARAITIDDLDVEDAPTSERASDPVLQIEPTRDSDRASTQMIESPDSDLPPSASQVFQDDSDVGPISSVRPGPAAGLLSADELFDDSAFTEVGADEASDVFNLEISTGEKSLPPGPVLVDREDAADLAALLEGELDPDDFDGGGDGDHTSVGFAPEDDRVASAKSDGDDMGMLIDEEGSIEFQAPPDDQEDENEPTSPSVPPPAATASQAPTPSKPPENKDPKPPDGTSGGGEGKGFFKKIFGR